MRLGKRGYKVKIYFFLVYSKNKIRENGYFGKIEFNIYFSIFKFCFGVINLGYLNILIVFELILNIEVLW